jgi:hypothetical protein
MKASELRIGNIIKDDRKAKEWRFASHRIISDLASNPNIELYHPVELSVDWLDKFGFDHSFGEWHKTFDIDGEKYSLYKRLKEGWVFEDIQLPVQPQYVHQLQNLYWCLCGEELTIKE